MCNNLIINILISVQVLGWNSNRPIPVILVVLSCETISCWVGEAAGKQRKRLNTFKLKFIPSSAAIE